MAISVENRNFSPPHPLGMCNDGRARKIYGHAPIRQWKEFGNICLCLDTIPKCDEQMDEFAIKQYQA